MPPFEPVLAGRDPEAMGRPEYSRTLVSLARDGDEATMTMLLSFAREPQPSRLRTWARALLERAGRPWQPGA